MFLRPLRARAKQTSIWALRLITLETSRARKALPNFVALRLPLPEVYSNMGAVASRLGKQKEAAEYFQKAAQADSNDADYRFNLAVVLSQSGSRSEAAEN